MKPEEMTPEDWHVWFRKFGFVEYLGSCGACGAPAHASVNPAERPVPQCLECGASAMTWTYLPAENP
jgi:hypothetical protein